MIKPIQTRYAGYFFRSRLEARWAVFFDTLRLDWSYEPEGFELVRHGYYLPDFRVMMRGYPVWFEIKPGNEAEYPPFTEFINSSPGSWRGAVLNEIPDPRYVSRSQGYWYPPCKDTPYCLWGQTEEDMPDGGWDNHFRFCVCKQCGEVGFEFDGRSARIGCGCSCHKDSDKNYTPDHPRIVAAFAAARAARFEHDAREIYVSK